MTDGHKTKGSQRMVKVGKKIVKYRVVILILSVLLLIPSAMGYFGTRINYDVLTYLPENIETMNRCIFHVDRGWHGR